MSRYTFIVNPEAGKGRGRRALRYLREEIQERDIDAVVVETRGLGDATKLAASADAEIVVAVGGDGTINEVANGIVETGKVLGVIAAGSGNDFIKSARIPKRTVDSFNVLLADHRTRLDVGSIVCGSQTERASSNSQGRYFVNGVGIGFDAAVAEQTRHINVLSGVPLYLLAVARALRSYKPVQFRIQVDGVSSEGRKLLAAVGNGACAGGGFYLTPDAVLDDGLLDVCVIEAKSVFQIIRLVPKVMRARHEGTSGVDFYRGKLVEINVDSPVCVHADGEIIAQDVKSVRIEARSKGLTVITT